MPESPKAWKDSSWPERMKLMAFSLIPVVVLLVAAELLAYSVIYRDIRVEADPISGEPAIYRMQFGRGWWGEASETPLNSFGLPDREFYGYVPKGDCIHVVFSGDSFAFGDAVNRHRNFVSIVERNARRSFPDRCLRFFNLGERMTTIEQQGPRILETFDLLDPDLVILVQYQNDLTDLMMPGGAAHDVGPVWAGGDGGEGAEAAGGWGDVIRARVPFRNANLVRFLSYQAFAFLITRGIEFDTLHQWSVLVDPDNRELADRLTGIYGDLYGDLVLGLRRKGVEFGTVVIPSKLDVMAGEYPEEGFFLSLAVDHEVPTLSVFEVLDRTRRPYMFQMYDGHLSEAGNALVAAEVFRWLFPRDDPGPFAAISGLSDVGSGPPAMNPRTPAPRSPSF